MSLSPVLDEDLAAIRADPAVHPQAIARSVMILEALTGGAAETARVGASGGGCSVAWPHRGIFCEVDASSIELNLFIHTSGLRIETPVNVRDAARRLNAVVNTTS